MNDIANKFYSRDSLSVLKESIKDESMDIK